MAWNMSSMVDRKCTNSSMAGGMMRQKKPAKAASINNRVAMMDRMRLRRWSLNWKNFTVG